MRGRERHISWGRLQVATSPFDKTFANVHCALRNCVSSRLKVMGRGGGNRGIRRADVPRSRLWYAKLVVVVLVGFPSSSYWIIQIIMLPKNEMTLRRGKREREREGGELTGSWQHIVHISATICCNCANCNSLFRLSYGLFQAHHHICYIWYVCVCVWQRCHCELTKCWAKYPQDMCLLISLETLTFYLHRLHGARGVVMVGEWGAGGDTNGAGVWCETRLNTQTKPEMNITLHWQRQIQLQMEYSPPHPNPSPLARSYAPANTDTDTCY